MSARTAHPDPHDPLAPRPDDPALMRRWAWRARLYDRPDPRRSALRSPLGVVLVMLLVSLAAFGAVLLLQSA